MAQTQSIKARAQIAPAGLFILAAFAAGLIIGLATLPLQGLLPGASNFLANSGAVWTIAAWVFGMVAASPRRAIGAGIAALAGEVLGYYTLAWTMQLMDINTGTLAVVGVWLLMALLAGTLFGLAGHAAGHRGGISGTLGRAALGGLFIGEGLNYLITLGYVPTGLIWLAIAAAITAITAWKSPRPARVWLAAALLGALFFGGFLALGLLDSLRAAAF